METLEIQNPHYSFNFFVGIEENTMVMPSVIMLTATTKLFIGFFLNIVILLGVAISGWKIAESHEYA